jgi:hypothetical protein
MAIDISKAFATSFAHSQYDIHAISGRLHCRAASIREILASASAVCVKAN